MTLVHFIRKYLKSILMYGIVVSGLAALAEWSSFAALVFGTGMHYVAASVIAFLVGTSVNAVLSRSIGFTSKGRSGIQETLLIYVTSALAFLLNVGAMVLIVEVFTMHVMVGKIAGTVAAFFANYLLRQFFIFSSTPRWK